MSSAAKEAAAGWVRGSGVAMGALIPVRCGVCWRSQKEQSEKELKEQEEANERRVCATSIVGLISKSARHDSRRVNQGLPAPLRAFRCAKWKAHSQTSRPRNPYPPSASASASASASGRNAPEKLNRDRV